MIQFLNPIWLWGLTGLLVPVTIHLLSRKEGKIIRFGSLRHLQESNTARFRSIRLNEIFLLLLRSLFFTCIVLFLAGMYINLHDQKNNAKWFVFEKGLEKSPEFQTLHDSLQSKGYSIHYLTSGFPAFKDSSKVESVQNYWALIEELEAKPLQDVIVASYNFSENFKGERISIPENIRWITFEPATSTFPAKVIRLSEDSTLVRVAHSTANTTSFHSQKIKVQKGQKYFKFSDNGDSVAIANADSLTINIVSDNDFKYDRSILLASLNAIQTIAPLKLVITNYGTADWNNSVQPDWLIILTNKEVSYKAKRTMGYSNCIGTNFPALLQGAFGTFSCSGAKELDWIITKRLNEEVALKENLTVQLAKILLAKFSTGYPTEKDKRVLGEQWIKTKPNEKPLIGQTQAAKSLDPFLIVLLFITLVTERVVAYKKNQ